MTTQVPLYPEQPLIPGKERTPEDGRDLYLHLIKAYFPELGACSGVGSWTSNHGPANNRWTDRPSIQLLPDLTLMFRVYPVPHVSYHIQIGMVRNTDNSQSFTALGFVYFEDGRFNQGTWDSVRRALETTCHEVRLTTLLNEMGMR